MNDMGWKVEDKMTLREKIREMIENEIPVGVAQSTIHLQVLRLIQFNTAQRLADAILALFKEMIPEKEDAAQANTENRMGFNRCVESMLSRIEAAGK